MTSKYGLYLVVEGKGRRQNYCHDLIHLELIFPDVLVSILYHIYSNLSIY